MTRDSKIKATNGKELPVVTVIAITLEHLKTLILKEIEEEIRPANIKLQWILTVPAIWSEAGKGIMREAAEKVHIYGSVQLSNLKLMAAITHVC